MLLLFGTMGEVGPQALGALQASQALCEVVLVDFPQNVHRDFAGYARELMKAVKEFGADTVMPVGNPLSMAMMKARLEEDGVRVLVEDEEKIRLLDSKVAFAALVEKLGIRQPRMYSIEEAKTALDSGVKMVFKRDVSFAGHGVHVPQTAQALENLIAHQSPGEAYLIEGYINGEDWSIDAVRLGGDFFRAQAYINRNGRRVVAAGSETYEYIYETARRILGYLDYCGVCGFDFRVTKDGQAYILEANPRLTGGLGTQLASGFNIPALLAYGPDA